MNEIYDTNIFQGFPVEFADFLFSLRFNNTVDLLPDNKPVYKRLITEPLIKLYRSLAPAALSVSETVVTKPSKCVSTMYNDMRFSKGSPLKEYMYVRFREAFNDTDILGLFFDMGCDYYGYGIRIYKQTGAGMERIRQKAVECAPRFTRELENLNRLNMKLIGDNFTKDRYPEIDNVILKGLLNKKGFYVELARPIGEQVFDGRLSGEITEGFRSVKGFYLLLKDAL
jgi:uncharacterized protein (DUF2461 family)